MSKKNWKTPNEGVLLRGDYPRELLNLKAGLQLVLQDIVGDDKAGAYLALPRLPDTVLLQALTLFRQEYPKIRTFYERYFDPTLSTYANSPTTAALAKRTLRQDREVIERLDRLVQTLNTTRNLQELRRAYTAASDLVGQSDSLFPRPNKPNFSIRKAEIGGLEP